LEYGWRTIRIFNSVCGVVKIPAVKPNRHLIEMNVANEYIDFRATPLLASPTQRVGMFIEISGAK
jgi:hypothetical protein